MPPMKQPALHIPLWHTSPLPQPVPSLRGACAQLPALSQASLVQGLPSSGQFKPAAMGWWTGTPFSQMSAVQGLLSSTGTHGAPVPPLPPADELLADEPPAASAMFAGSVQAPRSTSETVRVKTREEIRRVMI